MSAWAIVAGVCGGIAVLAAGTAGLVYLTRPMRRLAAAVADFLADWRGEPARDGVPARPGVMVRLAEIQETQADHGLRLSKVERELSPDGGRSMRDRVEAVAVATGAEPQP
jgi:hypothetical protein